MKQYIMYYITFIVIISGCVGCNQELQKEVSKDKDISTVKKELIETNTSSSIDENNSITPNASIKQTDDSYLLEDGSPANPYKNNVDDDDPNSPKNAKEVDEDASLLDPTHPMNAKKISSDDPDLLDRGSPANPIEDFTGEDISQNE